MNFYEKKEDLADVMEFLQIKHLKNVIHIQYLMNTLWYHL